VKLVEPIVLYFAGGCFIEEGSRISDGMPNDIDR